MLLRAAVALILIAVVAVIAALVNRRRPGASPTITGQELPSHVERSDFVAPDSPWLIVVFSSATCQACAGVWAWAQSMESENVAVQDVEAKTDAALQKRYAIDSVPATLIVDERGVVRYDVLGPLSPNDERAISELVHLRTK